MLWFVGQSVVFLVLAFALGVVVGWLLWGRNVEPPPRTVPFGVPHSAGVTRVTVSGLPPATREPAPAVVPPMVVAHGNAAAELAVLRTIDPQLILRATGPEPEADLNGHRYEYAGDGDVVVEAAVVDLHPEDVAVEDAEEYGPDDAVFAERDVDAPQAEDAGFLAADPARIVVPPEPVAAVDPDPTGVLPAVIDPDPTVVLQPVVERTTVLEPVAAEHEHEPEPADVLDLTVFEEPAEIVTHGRSRRRDRHPGTISAMESAGVMDDLRRIEGIGPKISAALVAGGITGFRQLAEAAPADVGAALAAAGVRSAPGRATWADQARLLAEGDEDGHAELRGRLAAARKSRTGG